MADKRNYSVDDILDEIIEHKSASGDSKGSQMDIDDIIGLKSEGETSRLHQEHKMEIAKELSPEQKVLSSMPEDAASKEAMQETTPAPKRKRRSKRGKGAEKVQEEQAQPKPSAEKPKKDKPLPKANKMVFSPEELAETRTIFAKDDEPIKKPRKEKPRTNDDDGRMSFEDHDITPIGQKPTTASVRKTRGNDALLESLNTSLKERQSAKQTEDENAQLEQRQIFQVSNEIKKKVIEDTEQMTMEQPVRDEDKIRELKARRKQKIRDFVLEPSEEGVRRHDNGKAVDSENQEIDDYGSPDDAPSILSDLLQIQGSLLLRLFMLLCMGLCALYIGLANSLDLPLIEYFQRSVHPEGYLYVNIILGVLAAFVSYTVVAGGLGNLLTMKADSDSVAATAIVVSVFAAIMLLFDPSLVQVGQAHLYIVVAIFGLIFNTLGKLQIIGRTKRNFRFVSGDSPKYAANVLENESDAEQFTRGTMNDFPVLAGMRKTDFLTDFLKHSYSVDYADRLSKAMTPIILLLSLVLSGAIYFLFHNINVSISVFAAAVCVSSPFSTMLIVNIPLSKVSQNLVKQSAVVLGYSTVEEFSDVNSLLVDVNQLFPEGSIDLIGFKIFGNTKIDEAFLDAASLSIHAGSVLSHMFYDVIGGKKTMLKQVESYIYEDSMGLSGWIGNKRVLLGNRELMRNHSIDLPPISKEQKYVKGDKNVIYLSISGDLAAMFIVEMKPNYEVKRYLQELERQEIHIMLRTVDSIVSINKLSDLFEISPNLLKLLPFRLHESFDEHTGYLPRHSGALSCNGRFVSLASALVACKRIRRNVMLGAVVQISSVILGLGLVSVLTILSALNQFTAPVMLSYSFVWTILVLMFQGVRKL